MAAKIVNVRFELPEKDHHQFKVLCAQLRTNQQAELVRFVKNFIEKPPAPQDTPGPDGKVIVQPD